MIIRRVRGKKPLQMARVQSDDVVEQIAAAAPHPTLGHSILPRTPNRGLHARDLQGAKGSGYFQAIFLVVIEKQEFWVSFAKILFSREINSLHTSSARQFAMTVLHVPLLPTVVR